MNAQVTRPVTIRAAEVADAKSILEVHRSAVLVTAAPWYDFDTINAWAAPLEGDAINQMAAIITAGSERILVATNGQRVVGFGSIVPEKRELRAVYVHSDFGRAGIGGRLLTALENLARQRHLTELTMDASLNAEEFYARHGFVVVEIGERALRGGALMRCVRMRKALGP